MLMGCTVDAPPGADGAEAAEQVSADRSSSCRGQEDEAPFRAVATHSEAAVTLAWVGDFLTTSRRKFSTNEGNRSGKSGSSANGEVEYL